MNSRNSNNSNDNNHNNNAPTNNDRSNNHGVFHDLLEANPQIGHTIRNFVRGFLNHVQQRNPSQPQPPPHTDNTASMSHSSVPTDVSQTPSELDSIASAVDAEQGSNPSGERNLEASPNLVFHSLVLIYILRQSPQTQSELNPSARSSSRRARVDDDEEGDPRETNRQRMHSPQLRDDAPGGASSQAPHAASNPRNPTEALGVLPPAYSRVVYTFDFVPTPLGGMPFEARRTVPNDASAQNPSDNDRRDGEHHGHGHGPLPRFNFSFNIPMPPPGPGVPPAGNAPPRNAPNLPNFMPFADALRQLMQEQIGDVPFVFGMPFPSMLVEDREDPERAKRLLGGLEAVSLGLLKRLERVSGEDPPCCAVCFDRLLESVEDVQLKGDVQTDFDGSEVSDGEPREVAMEVDDIPAPQSSSDTHSSQLSKDILSAADSTSSFDKIVVLPCAHVFHASCLLPWFTQPHRTTCPSCRFDIDPDSLTYVPRPSRTRRTPPQPRPDGQPQTQPQTQAADNNETARPAGSASGTNNGAEPANGQEARNDAPNPTHGTPLPPMVTFDLSMFIPMVGAPRPPHAPRASQADQTQTQNDFASQSLPNGPADQTQPTVPAGQAPWNGTFVPIDDPQARAHAMNIFETLLGGTFTPMGTPPPDFPGFTDNPSGPGILPDFPTAFGHIPRPASTAPRNAPSAGSAPAATSTATPAAGVASGPGARIPPPPPPIHPQFFPDFFPMPRPPRAGSAPTPQSGTAQPGTQAQATPQDDEVMFDDFWPFPGIPAEGVLGWPPVPPDAGPRPGLRRRAGGARLPEKRQWTLPPPPGPTLRQRVETRERELGMRCCDISCGLGPSDEDPSPVIDGSTVRRISIRPLNAVDGNKVCEHTFHPACLVSAERVAGWGSEDNKEEKVGEQVEVSCPVCRAVGYVSREDWDEGACALA